MINFKRYKCYYDHEHCLEDISPRNLLPSLLLPLKLYQRIIFLPISRQIRICETFWKVPLQTNGYISNK
ncbi:hypothetical protein T06_6480 [Trichinella sp. T6]|nr:hypothetical protein T06_6480 [Trichinella sp. T6]